MYFVIFLGTPYKTYHGMGSKDRQIYNILKKGDLFVNNVKTDVLFTTEVQRIMTNQNQKQLIVPRSSEKDRIINHFYKQINVKGLESYATELKITILECLDNAYKNG